MNRHSVITQGHYVTAQDEQTDLIDKVIGKSPKLLFDIHDQSDVNRPQIDLSEIEGPATSDDFLPNQKIEQERRLDVGRK